jgi:hypothetical protein
MARLQAARCHASYFAHRCKFNAKTGSLPQGVPTTIRNASPYQN